MPIKKFTVLTLSGLLLFALAGTTLRAQEKRLKKVPVRQSDPSSGVQMYKDYCAACHGVRGRGDGPAAEFLKTPPPDLRTLAQRNNGEYPALRVKTTLLFGTSSHAHGTSDMPLWGSLFRSQDGLQATNAPQLRIYNLTNFVESLQQK